VCAHSNCLQSLLPGILTACVLRAHVVAQRWHTLEPEQCYDDIAFVPLDVTSHASLVQAMRGCAVVVHTAGPFQVRAWQRAQHRCCGVAAPLVFMDVNGARIGMIRSSGSHLKRQLL
jgi:hypothetical protein